MSPGFYVLSRGIAIDADCPWRPVPIHFGRVPDHYQIAILHDGGGHSPQLAVVLAQATDASVHDFCFTTEVGAFGCSVTTGTPAASVSLDSSNGPPTDT